MRRGSLWFSQKARFHEGERESIYQCMPAILILTLFSFWLFSFFPSHSFLFYSLASLFKFLFLSQGSPFFSLSLFTARPSFYSTCHDRILLFQPLTSFVQSRCTGRPSLFRLCATPHHQTKKDILFTWLSWHPFLATVWVLSLSISLMACIQWFQLSLPLLDSKSSQQDTSPKKPEPKPQKQIFPLSPPPNHAL